MNKKPIMLVVAAAGVVAVSWYSLIVVPSVRRPATGAGGVNAAPYPSASARADALDPTAQAGGAALEQAQSASNQPSVDSPEQLAIANARKPIEEQAPDVQQRFYEGMLMGLRRAQDLQRGSLARLEQQLQTTSDPAARARLDQQIEQRRKWLTERDQQIAEYQARVPASGP